MSLRRRVLLGIVAVAVVLVLSNLALAATFRGFLLEQVDARLVDTAALPELGGAGRPGPGARDGPLRVRGGQRRPITVDRALTEFYIAVSDGPRGALRQVGSSLSDDEQGPPAADAVLYAERASGPGEAPAAFTVPGTERGAWRLIALGDRLDGGLLVVGVSLDDVEATIDRMRLVQVAGSAAVLAALAAMSWWVLRLGVRPLAGMVRTADAIAAGDLGRRVEHVDERTEAGRLGTAFNTMLDEIEEAFRQRAASEERVRRFAADASHELRTPLTSIRGYTELWQAGGFRKKGELADAMRRMNTEAQRMGALVDDLLVLARLDQSPVAQRVVEYGPVALDALVTDAVHDARAVEPDRPIHLDVEPVGVMGDEQQLRQVIANLLANARAHTPPGTPVHVSARRNGEVGVMAVADEGPGMASDVTGRVFERFYRADASRARNRGGSGLGLSIVAAVAESHGGRASVTSQPGEGSRFVVELPLSP